MRRCLTTLLVLFALALPAAAERPRPLGWAMDAMRDGNWQVAAQLASRDGQAAADVIEWHRLRAGYGTFEEVADFLIRRPNWPGEAYLRRQSERAVIREDDVAILAFFTEMPAQTANGVLAQSAALIRAGRKDEAEALLIDTWQTMPMGSVNHALFLAEHDALLKPHHARRLDKMLWRGAFENAQRMYDLVPKANVVVAKARIALQKRAKGVDTLIDAVPKSHANDPGLQYDRFVWRARKGRMADTKALLLERSTSATALGEPEAWGNRRRALARDEMRDGDPKRAYALAARHFLTEGSNYADLEWIAGYIALTKLNDPEIALNHFNNHNAAVKSPISKGRAGYWRGRALEAMGDAAGADQAYTEGAQYQTSFYGLLAAERAGLPFDPELNGVDTPGSWRDADFAESAVFEAGMLLQASGELDLAERFWTHLAESLSEAEAIQLGQAALDADQPHLAVMIGKRAARRGLVAPAAYYPLHPLADQSLPMAPEMVLSIARRESEFDARVRSGVGARGLMQIMPATGREVAAGLGRKKEHSTERLTTDPEYAAELGAAYLATLARQFSGNVVMISAGYNAGPSRPDRWMRIYGDPREGQIDIVDWIEHIPFRETRNYVMRVAESLPIYRARLGKNPLPRPFSQELTGSTLLAFAPKGE